jgi:hypothetical protein
MLSSRPRIPPIPSSFALLFLSTLTISSALPSRAEERFDVSGDPALPPLWEDPASAPLHHRSLLQPVPGKLAAQALPEDAAWEGFVAPGPNGFNFRIGEWQGKLVLALNVSAAGHVACPGIAIWNGTDFEALPRAGSPQLLTIWNGQVVIAALGPYPLYNQQAILRFNGTLWDTLGVTNDYPYDMTEWNGKLVVAGRFSSVSGVPVNHVAAFDGSTWSALGGTTPTGYQVEKLTVHAGSLIAGMGDLVSGTVVAAWNNALGVWQAVGPNITAAKVEALQSDGTRLYVTGNSLASGGTSFSSMAFWDGVAWTGVPAAVSKSVHSMTLWNGHVIAAIPHGEGRLMQLDGATATTLPGDSLGYGSGGGIVWFLGTWGTRLVATGTFVANGSRWIPAVAIYDGSEWSTVGIPWDATMRSPVANNITALEPWNGKLVAAGSFSLVADQDHYLNSVGIGAFDGTHWAPVGPNPVFAQFRNLGDWNGDLVVAGYTLSIGGTTIRNVARWNGVSWSQVGSTAPQYGDALQSFHGDLYLTHEDYFPSDTYIARFDGVTWQSLGSGLNGYSASMCVHGDSLVVGGYFTLAGGQGANRIAAWDGAAWHALGDGFNNTVYAVDSWNGTIVAGGPFTASGAQPVAGAAIWDGTSWQQMGSNAVYLNYIEAEDGELFASGSFRLPDASVISTVAHWTGTDWHLLGSGTNMYPFALYDGYLYQAGSGTVHGHVSHGLSRVPLSAVLDAPRPQPRATAVSLAVRPNPVRGPARFSVVLPAAAHVRLTVHDVAGRVLVTLHDGELGAGEHPIEWAGKASPGIYFVQLATPSARTARRFVLLRP